MLLDLIQIAIADALGLALGAIALRSIIKRNLI